MVQEVLASLVLGHHDHSAQFKRLLDGLPSFEQRNLLYSVLKILPKVYLSASVEFEDDINWWHADEKMVAAAASLIILLMDDEELRKNQLITWLTSSSGAGVGDDIAIRRAAAAALSTDKTDIETILDKSLHQFGDQLYIRHTPTLQQEGMSYFLLIGVVN